MFRAMVFFIGSNFKYIEICHSYAKLCFNPARIYDRKITVVAKYS